MEYRRHPENAYRFWLVAPLTYAMLVPLVILDFCFAIYQNVCFRILGLPILKRSDYVVFDRRKLRYLNWIERVNCEYCGYANGLLHYASAIAAASEKYWCAIQHAKQPGYKPPPHHGEFLPYDDSKALDAFVQKK